ncbi:MAG: SRPBCC family protein [Dehalococcoidia bacterium]
MARYRFVTDWRFDAPIEDVWAALLDSERWPEWWQGVRRVEQIEAGDADGIGNVRRYTFRSALPYDLVFDVRSTRIEMPRLLEGLASGELEGVGLWRLVSGPTGTRVRYLWDVRTRPRWMNLLGPLLRPAFVWNHDWVMRQGERGLRAYLQRGGPADAPLHR